MYLAWYILQMAVFCHNKEILAGKHRKQYKLKLLELDIQKLASMFEDGLEIKLLISSVAIAKNTKTLKGEMSEVGCGR